MHTRKFFGALVAALIATVDANADDSGFYLGAAVGEATQSNSDFDGSDTSFKWLGGYSFSTYFAAEAGFVDAGKQKDTIGAVDVTSSSDGIFVALLAKLPLGKVVAPYVRLGYVFYDTTTTVERGSLKAFESTDGEDPIYSGGIEFRLGGNFRLRAEYEKVDVPGVDFDIVSLVATYQF